jgi:predicted phosphodiesterase
MPISLPPISRRRFVGGSIGAGLGLIAAAPWLRAAQTPAGTADHVALLSDSHVAADKALVFNKVHLSENLSRCVAEVTALKDKPAFALLNGDCALKMGEQADYATFLELMKPLRDAGMAVHLTLGNHDDRETFWRAMGPQPGGRKSAVYGKHVTVVEAPRANWFLLDSLDVPNLTPGVLGEKQIAWLAKALDAQAAKPAIIVTHHNPPQAKYANHPGGITDWAALSEVILPRKQVKTLIFGHTHDWTNEQLEGVHLINLPPTAYVFAAGRPNGWVDAYVREDGMSLELHALDEKHPEHGQKVDLKWR